MDKKETLIEALEETYNCMLECYNKEEYWLEYEKLFPQLFMEYLKDEHPNLLDDDEYSYELLAQSFYNDKIQERYFNEE